MAYQHYNFYQRHSELLHTNHHHLFPRRFQNGHRCSKYRSFGQVGIIHLKVASPICDIEPVAAKVFIHIVEVAVAPVEECPGVTCLLKNVPHCT